MYQLTLKGFDATNNVEQIYIRNPPNAQYSVYVFGRAIPTGTQQVMKEYIKLSNIFLVLFSCYLRT